MTVRLIENVHAGARPSIGNYFARASYRLAFVAGTVLFLVAAISQPLLSAPINYGSFVGTTVEYTDVTEDALSGDDDPPLFGQPQIFGNALDFDPVGFEATSSGGGVPDITDGQLKFGVMTNELGSAITILSIAEAGDTTLAGFGTNASFTSVTADGLLEIYEVDDAPLAPNIGILKIPFALTFTPSNGDFKVGDDAFGGPFYHEQWSGSITMNLFQILLANGITPVRGATKIGINMDNTLVAASEAGTTTLIAKKDFGGLSISVDQPGGGIPEPTSAILAGLAMLAGAGFGRRRM